MLPQIFRPDDPVLAVRLAAEHQHELERLLASLPSEVFRASDSLGWVYQFWQARRKKEVNASEVKIGADELPAVTQLFTEPYMVQFLLHNTLGAWWVGAGRKLPMEMPYLRLLDDGTPAAGTFEGWPRLVRDLKVLDPCCGSGHFLVAAFEILVVLRMAEEGLSAREACDAVLRDNLFGLEIDYRCVQIAAFALALAAWTYPDAGGYRPLAVMNVACSGLALSAKREEWEKLAGDNPRLRNGMGHMWALFKDAPVLGSLIDPMRDLPDPLYVAGPEELQPLLSKALARNEAEIDAEDREVRIVARGVNEAAKTLGMRFHLVLTNVPFLTGGRQADSLKEHCRTYFFDGRYDLGIAMLSRIFRFLAPGGSTAVVTPHNWLFLGSYKDFRKNTLRTVDWRMLARLGPRAFETIGGEVVAVALVVMSNSHAKSGSFFGVDLAEYDSPSRKAHHLISDSLVPLVQKDLLASPDSRVAFVAASSLPLLSRYVDCHQGLATGDLPRFGCFFWEVPRLDEKWIPWQSTVEKTTEYGGRSKALLWERGLGRLHAFNDAHKEVRKNTHLRGSHVVGKRGVVITQVGDLPATLYTGERYDDNTTVLMPHNSDDLEAIWAFCSSEEYAREVRARDGSLKVPANTLAKVPFDINAWRAVASERYPTGLPAPYSDRPDQWIFHGHPRTSDAPLQVAIARLLGFRWPDQQPDALDCHADVDGIVCIPALRRERPAADRLTDLLAAAWGKDWHPQTLTDLLVTVGHTGKLEEWLRDTFFNQHCEIFQHRPFIWHIWDGHREGFSALVNYHKLDHEMLKSLTYTYLGDWIRTQEIEAKDGKSGAGDKLAKAKALQQRLAAILEGEAPLDIFVRWKPIEQQPIGWHPDLDDGVRLNIRPFMTVADVSAKGKGAGVLRWKPNIKWGKDRGKNPPDSPWGEDRDNDKHLTLAEKRKAREAA
jgi:hypothetical protein